MREGPWKLAVFHPKAKQGTFENEKVELYNLEEDPSETIDLAAKYPDKAQEMLSKLKDWFIDASTDAPPQPGGWLKAE